MLEKAKLILNNCVKCLTDIIDDDKSCIDEQLSHLNMAEKRNMSVIRIFPGPITLSGFAELFSIILNVPTKNFIHKYFVIDDKEFVWLLLDNKNFIYDKTFKKLSKYRLDEETIKKIKDDPSKSADQQCILSVIMDGTDCIKTEGYNIHAVLDIDKLHAETEIFNYIKYKELEDYDSHIVGENNTTVDDTSVLSHDDVDKTSDSETWMAGDTLKADNSHDESESVSVNTDDEFTPPTSWRWSEKYKKYVDPEGNIYYRNGKKMDHVIMNGLFTGVMVYDNDVRIRAVNIVVDAFNLCKCDTGVSVKYRNNDSSDIRPANLICYNPYQSKCYSKSDVDCENRVKSAINYICSHSFNMIEMENDGYGAEKVSFIRAMLSTMRHKQIYFAYDKFKAKYIKNIKSMLTHPQKVIHLLTTDDENKFINVAENYNILYEDDGEGMLTAILDKSYIKTKLGISYDTTGVLYDVESDMYIKQFNCKTAICAKSDMIYIPYVHDVENTKNKTVYFNSKNWDISGILTRAGYYIGYKTK